MAYPFQQIESKWQEFWEQNKVFRSETSSDKPKLFILDMFPYPSGAGLHVGHPEGYTATDILCRYKKLRLFQSKQKDYEHFQKLIRSNDFNTA